MGAAPLDGCWYAVATTDTIGDALLPIEVLGTSYVIWRTANRALVAVRDRCPHREAPLSYGTVESGCLHCPYHGWSFGDGGRCVGVPSSGPGSAIPPGAHLDPLPVADRYGLVWFCPGEPNEPIPQLGVDDDSGFTRLNTGVQVWNCPATRMIDNMLDVAHFPYVHAGTFGREQEQVVPGFTLEQLDDTFHGYRYSVVVDNEGEAKAMSGGGDDVISIDMTTGFALPFSVRSTMSYDNGIEQTLFMTAAPIDDDRSYFTFVLWRNDDVSSTGREIVDFELEVAREDRAMLERLPGELSLERGALVDVASDKASLEWRRRYRSLLNPDAG
ncbi:MAG: aromatic ring-hydroxylating dioxygenase subunit alpha [Acidimicrobiia bacterium]|nr:aromatic ring-hydroxylating dioxygenase subunit alpha [Acidimicrobiia bacterium]